MNADDSECTVYTVAFSGKRFLMVWNSKRNGWEMPGGHIKIGERTEDGAVREFREEAGFEIEIVKTRNLGHCFVCAALLGPQTNQDSEMRTELFEKLPAELSFDRTEYEDTVPWAAKEIQNNGPPYL